MLTPIQLDTELSEGWIAVLVKASLFLVCSSSLGCKTLVGFDLPFHIHSLQPPVASNASTCLFLKNWAVAGDFTLPFRSLWPSSLYSCAVPEVSKCLVGEICRAFKSYQLFNLSTSPVKQLKALLVFVSPSRDFFAWISLLLSLFWVSTFSRGKKHLEIVSSLWKNFLLLAC